MSGVLVLSLLLRPYSMGAEKPDATRFFALRATLDDGAGNGWRREFHHKLPPFSVRDLKGRVWTLSDLHGRAVFLGAWATWCGPCREELPALQKLFDRYRHDAKVLVLTLDFDQDEATARSYVERHASEFPVLSAHGFLTQPVAMPTTWIVDRSGLVREETEGAGPAWFREATEWLDWLSREPARGPLH